MTQVFLKAMKKTFPMINLYSNLRLTRTMILLLIEMPQTQTEFQPMTKTNVGANLMFAPTLVLVID